MSPGLATEEPSWHDPLLQNAYHDDEAELGRRHGRYNSDSEVSVEGSAQHQGRSSWPLALALLLADMFGLGALTLPGVFSRLGSVGALVALCVGGLGMAYSGSLLTRLALAAPDLRLYHQLGERAMGRTGRRLVYATVYVLVATTPVVFHIICSEAVLSLHVPGVDTMLRAGLVTVALMAPLAQMQSMHSVGWVSVVGTATMFAAVGGVLGVLLLGGKGGGHGGGQSTLGEAAAGQSAPALWLLRSVEETGALSTNENASQLASLLSRSKVAIIALLDVLFSFGGQQNWLRFAWSLRRPAEFSRVTGAGAVLMTLAYVVIGGVGYARLEPGFDPGRPVTSVLPDGAVSTAVNACLLVHCLIAYQINLNVWTHLLLHAGHSPRNWLGRWVRWGKEKLGWTDAADKATSVDLDGASRASSADDLQSATSHPEVARNEDARFSA
ncbi:hypothetical protein H632_c430p2, partial [Helicosporidium sp. ATCC 50920]